MLVFSPTDGNFFGQSHQDSWYLCLVVPPSLRDTPIGPIQTQLTSYPQYRLIFSQLCSQRPGLGFVEKARIRWLFTGVSISCLCDQTEF